MRNRPDVVAPTILILVTLSTQLFAGAWTLKRGDLWVKTSFYYQKTKDRYFGGLSPACPLARNRNCKNGERVRFVLNGESKIKAVFLDLSYGLLDELQLNVQIPYYDLEFDDFGGDRNTTDIGDIRFGAQYRLIANPFVSSVKIEAKAPTGFFNRDAEVVPIGDDQWDLELMARFGKSLWPIPVYANLDVGYRFRFKPADDTIREPGNEFIFRAEAGYNVLKTLQVKAGLNGLYGNKFKQADLVIPDSQRQILFFEPGIHWNVQGPLAIDTGVQFSLSGKNYTAGQVFNFGLSYNFSLIK